jgi:hypothetical protein
MNSTQEASTGNAEQDQTQLKNGANPCRTANFPEENEPLGQETKEPPNILGQLDPENGNAVRWRKSGKGNLRLELKNRGKGKVWATIYKRPDKPQPYRLYWRVRANGKPCSRFKDFTTYSAAKQKGDRVVEDLHKHSQAATTSPAKRQTH